jgi:pimeloyl-ACP methyl ester carboxylesterase/ketosteroid isomerase-like protein
MKFIIALSLFGAAIALNAQAQSDSIVLKDITWDARSPAGTTELFIPSDDAVLPGFIYRANGPGKHPTLLLLHGFPGNERNLDLAQAVRAHGWNVIYFDYRGSWGTGGKFSFTHCVDDVIHAVEFCKKYQDSLQIDTSNMVLFGHSMGGWISLKALQRLPEIKKCFALSAWDIYPYYKRVLTQGQVVALENGRDTASTYFVLNATVKQMFDPVFRDTAFYNLAHDGAALADKQIVMLDEHSRNKMVADSIRSKNTAYFDYEVWNTDHFFTNKRASVIHAVIAFLDRGGKINCCLTTTAAEAQIREARTTSNEAIARQDADGIVRDMLPDYSIVTGRGQHRQGKDTLRAFWQQTFKIMPGVSYLRTPVSIVISSNDSLAWEEGYWTAEHSYSKGGNYSAMWRKTGASWKLASELFVALKD